MANEDLSTIRPAGLIGRGHRGGAPVLLAEVLLAAITWASPAFAEPTLSLTIPSSAVYVRPGEAVVVNMDVAGLPQRVIACQAMLGFSSTYLTAGPNCVSPGGGAWDELIYNSWDVGAGVPGEVDTAIGVNADGSLGTDADGTVAILTLTAASAEGATKVVFRPNADPDPGLVKSTFLSDLSSNMLWPLKQDSQTIIIDGTPPATDTAGIVAVQQQPFSGAVNIKDCSAKTIAGTVSIAVPALDGLSGLANVPMVQVSNGVESEYAVFVGEEPAGRFQYAWTVTPNTAAGTWTVVATATDRAENVSSVAFALCVDHSLSWVSEDSAYYSITCQGFHARCNKATGLCDFYGPNSDVVFADAGDAYVGRWLGKLFDGVEVLPDQAWFLRSQLPVTGAPLSVSGDQATWVVTQENEAIRFVTTYSFDRLGSQVPCGTTITYLQPADVTSEIIRTDIPGAFETAVVDRMDLATLTNPVQPDSMDTSVAEWSNGPNATVEAESSRVREGTGSLKMTFLDNNDGRVNSPVVYKTFAPITIPSATHLSFWVYPEQKMRLIVTLRRGRSWYSAYTYFFEPNRWTRFQWDLAKSGISVTDVDLVQFASKDNGDSFSGPQATAYIDDISFADAIQDGIYTASTSYDGWYGWVLQTGTLSLDETFFLKGNAALKWDGLDLSKKNYLQQLTMLSNSKASSRFPSDVSTYDYLAWSVYASKAVTLTVEMKDRNSRSRYKSFSLPAGTWYPVMWRFREDFLEDGPTDLSAIVTLYLVTQVAPGGGTGTLWVDDMYLESVSDGFQIFDGQTGRYSSSGRAVKYSTRRYKSAGGRVYGDTQGAFGIEAMEKNQSLKTLDAFLRHVDFHTVVSGVNRDGIDSVSTYYKEQRRQAGEVVEGAIVYDFGPGPQVEVVKSRHPRAHRMGYSISDDDFYLRASQAYYCGTSDPGSPNYCRKGVIGHNLLATKLLWYYLSSTDGGGTYLDNPQVKPFYDLLHANGLEIGIHSPGPLEDVRSAIIPALDDLCANYGVRHWVDHSATQNPEDIARRGLWPTYFGKPNDTDAGYYIMDLLRARNFDMIWGVTTFTTIGSSCNLFFNAYKDGFPLPHDNQLLGKNAAGRTIYIYQRSSGPGATEYLQRGGGGNIQELQEIIANEGLVIVYTHAHLGYYNTQGGMHVLRGDVDDVFAWLEGQQDAGVIWVTTVAKIIDWLLDLELVTVDGQEGNLVTVQNRAAKSTSGVTLKVLDNTVQSAKIGNLYQIYVDDDFVVLPTFGPNETKKVEIEPGSYPPWMPRLTHVDAHVDVLQADFDPLARKVTVAIGKATDHDVRNKSVTVWYNQARSFDVTVDGTVVGVIRNGVVVTSAPAYGVSYPNDELSLRVPVLSANTIAVYPAGSPLPSNDLDKDFDDDGDVDMDDVDFFNACATGPGIEQPNPACREADFDGDGDVDQTDFASLQSCLSGSDVPVAPDCAW